MGRQIEDKDRQLGDKDREAQEMHQSFQRAVEPLQAENNNLNQNIEGLKRMLEDKDR